MLGFIGLWEAILIVIPVAIVAMGASSSSTLVIKSWRAEPQADADGNFIAIKGREAGLLSWLLALGGIDATTSIIVNNARVEFSQASLAGSSRRLIPLQNVCSTYYGYKKPWLVALVIGLFGLVIMGAMGKAIGGESMMLIFALLGGGIGFLYYFLNKTLTLGFVENSGVSSVIQFRRSVIENENIDEVKAGYICTLVEALIERRQALAVRHPLAGGQ